MIGPLDVRVGTSGWQYDSWRGALYPAALRQPAWLEWYAQRFATVEVNNTFYQLPARDAVRRWHDATPAGFTFALKFSRYFTHVRRLNDPSEAVRRFFERVEPLEEKLGPVLLQLPPTLEGAPSRLAAVLEAFPSGVRVAVEFRHASWFTGEVRRILERHDAALCLADRGSRPLAPLWRTAGWGYLRLHEGRATPRPCYGRQALARWVERLDTLFPDGDEVFIYFNNDARACAVRNASMFRRLVERPRAPRGSAATQL